MKNDGKSMENKIAVENNIDEQAPNTAQTITNIDLNSMKSIWENAAFGIFTSDSAGRLKEANPYFSHFMDCDTNQVIGKNIFDFLDDESRIEFENGWNAIKTAKASAVDLKVKLISGIGSKKYVSASLMMSAGSNKEAYLIGVLTDQCELQKYEEEQKFNETRLQTMVDFINMVDEPLDKIAKFALDEGIRLTRSLIGYVAFLDIKQEILTMYAWSENAMEECKMEFKPRVYPVESTGLWGEAVRQRKPIITNDYIADNPWKRGTPDGHIPLIRHMNVPILDGERIVIVAGVGNKADDYTDIDVKQLTLLMTSMWRTIKAKENLDSLKEREVWNRQIVETASEGIWSMDAQRNTTFVNQRMADMLGVKPEEMLGKPVTAFMYEDDLPAHQARMKERFVGKNGKYEQRFMRKDGKAIWCVVSATVLFTPNGEVDGSFAMFTDITERKIAEDKLALKDKLLQSSLNNAPFVLFALDHKGIFTVSEGKSLAKLGLVPSQVVGLDSAEVYKDFPLILQDIKRAINGEEFSSLSTLNDLAFEVWYKPLTDEEGNPAGTIGVSVDISERYKAETELAKSEEKLRELFNSSHDGLTYTSKDGVIQECNPAFAKMLGYKQADQLIGKKYHDLSSPIYLENDHDEVSRRLEDSGFSGAFEKEYIKQDGSIITGLTRIWYRKDKNNQLIGIWAQVQDLTDIKRVGQELWKSQEMMRLILDTIPEKVFWKDRDCCYVGGNAAFLKISGLENQDGLLGKSDREFVWKQYAEQYNADDRKVLDTGEPLTNFEELSVDADGNKSWLRTNKVPLRNIDGEIIGVLGSFNDITETKLVQEQLLTSEMRFRNLANNAPVGIYENDASGKNVYVNQQWMRLTGFDHFPAGTDEWIQGIHPDDVHNVQRSWMKLMMEQTDFSEEYRRIRPDGSIIWVSDQEKAIFDETGKLTGYLGTLMDITERMKAEEEVRQSLSLNLATLESTNDGILVIDVNKTVSSYNQKYLELWDIEDCELQGSLQSELLNIVSEKVKDPIEFVARIEQIHKHADGKFQDIIRLKNGKILERFSQPQQLDDQVIGRVWSFSDVTSRFTADEKLRQNFEENQQMLKRLTALRNIDIAITGHQTFLEIMREILPNVLASLDVDVATILLPTTDGKHLSLVAYDGIKQIQDLSSKIGNKLVPMEDNIAGKAFRDRKAIVLPILDGTDSESSPNNRIKERFSYYAATPLIAKDEVRGVLEVFSKKQMTTDRGWKEFLNSLSMQMAIAIDNADLFSQMQRTNLDLLAAYEATIEGWARALELRDKETLGHSERVIDLTLRLARELGVPQSEWVQLRRGVFLHDIGKMGIPDNILLKPGPLTDDEWVIMKQHPSYAYEMLSGIPYLQPALDIPYCHHERWDGSGYPRELAGEDIPLGARIFAVVDVWDALSSKRPYRPAWPSNDIVTYLKDQSSIQFDPQVVDAFLAMIKNLM